MGVPLLLVTVNRGITVESWASWLYLRLMLHKLTRHFFLLCRISLRSTRLKYGFLALTTIPGLQLGVSLGGQL